MTWHIIVEWMRALIAALQQLKLIDVSGCRTAWWSFDRLERILGFFGEAVT